uniref:Acyl-CoA dehydrogenase n=1 Tax=Streptomyces sp. CNQ-418 TaxID=467194 RepID=J7H3Q7_9ACTN|nr:acyl-CoA dehydrogenase [Streptomyces sp. CNQ-418]
MRFDWSPDQQAAYRHTLAAVRDRFAEPTKGEFFDREGWRFLGDQGLLGLSIPTEYGGGGLGALDTARHVEALGLGCADTGLVFGASAHLFACAMPLAAFGTETARNTYLPGMASGALIAGNAMTEDGAGSDVSRLATTATETRGGYLLNGTKSFVTNGPISDVYITYATTDPYAGHLGITGFVVPADADGVTPGPAFEKTGLTSVPAGTVTFDNCFVPREGMLGVPGQGGAIFQHSMGWERACLFAGYLGQLRRVLQRAVAHARTRHQFGAPLSANQAVSHRLVDTRLRLEAASLLLYRACWEMDQGTSSPLNIALSKLAVSEAAVTGALDAISVFGARGILTDGDTGVESALRDAVPATLFSGTSDIQRLIIAKEMGL